MSCSTTLQMALLAVHSSQGKAETRRGCKLLRFPLAEAIRASSARCNLGVKCFLSLSGGNVRSEVIWNLARRIHSVINNGSLFI